MTTRSRSCASARSCSASSALSAGGFSTRTCLPADERAAREVEVGGDGRCDDDGVDRVVGEHLVEVARWCAPCGKRGPCVRKLLGGRVADPGQPREIVEVAREVRAPVAEPGNGDVHVTHRGTRV